MTEQNPSSPAVSSAPAASSPTAGVTPTTVGATAPGAARSLRPLRAAALVLVVLAVAQAVLGSLLASRNDAVAPVHSVVAYLILLTSVVAAVLAFRFGRAVGRMGTFFHALSIPVLAVVQIGLAEMHAEAVHIVVGVVLLAAVVALYTLLRRV